MYIRQAKNGSGGKVRFCKKNVYHTISYKGDGDIEKLGKMLDKKQWIIDNIKSSTCYQNSLKMSHESLVELVENMMIDWSLYENGWNVMTYKNTRLFHYLAQIDPVAPPELNYITDC